MTLDMLLVGPNIFMGWSACLIFNIRWPSSSGENWGVVTSPLNTSSNLVNFGSRSGYRWTGNHRSDVSVRTKLINCLWYNSCFIFMCGFLPHWRRGVGDVFNMKSSPYGFNFCLLCVEISLVDNWTSFNQKKSFISCIGLSWLPSFSGEWWSEWAWSWLCASSSLKLQSCPELTWNQSDTWSDFIESTIALIWYEFDILHYLCLNLSWLKKNLSWSGR
jgi:hypothetical protein